MSTPLSRRFTVDVDQWVDELPIGWPEGVAEDEQILIMPRSVLCLAGRAYRVDIDIAALTATIREEDSDV